MNFVREKNKIYTGSAVFGPALNELQDINGYPYTGILSHINQYCVAYEVDPKKLADVLPNGYVSEFPAVIVKAELLSNVKWLGNRNYSRIEVLTPVSYKDVSGLFSMVTWENNGDSIIYGRDVHGIAKIFASIDSVEEKNSVEIDAKSWDFEFLHLDLKINEKKPSDELVKLLEKSDGELHLRYLPRTGNGFTETEACYTSFMPSEKTSATLLSCDAHINWNCAEFKDMPTQYHIVQKICEMDSKRIIGAVYSEFDRTKNGSDQVVLDTEIKLPAGQNKNDMYMAPANFGPCCGPRRGPNGKRFIYDNPLKTDRYAAICEVEDKRQLESLLPEGLSLRAPYLVIAVDYLSELAWLGNRKYALIAVNIPVKGDKTCGNKTGLFMSTIWENEVDPILTGREQLGFNKILCEIDDPVKDGKKVTIIAKEYGREFMRINLELGKIPQHPIKFLINSGTGDGIYHYKLMSHARAPFCKYDTECLCFQPQDFGAPDDFNPKYPKGYMKLGKAKVKFSSLSPEESPAHHRIIDGLSKIKIKNFCGGANILSYSANDQYSQCVLKDFKK